MEFDRLEEARVGVLEQLALNEQERAHLQRALESLDDASAATAPRVLAAPSPVAGAERPIPRGQLRRLFLAEVARFPGITVSQASMRLETTRDTLNPVIKQVLNEKLVVKNGAGYSLFKSKHKAGTAEATGPFTSLGAGDKIGIPLGSEEVAQRPPTRSRPPAVVPFTEPGSTLGAEEAP